MRRLIAAALYCSTLALGQAIPDTYQVGSASNLSLAGASVAIANSGTQGGGICVNVYVYNPDQEQIACCSYLLPPSTTDSISVEANLIGNITTGLPPTSVSINLVASTAVGNACTNSAATVTSASLATGLVASILPLGVGVTVVPFQDTTLTTSILESLTNRCLNILGNDSGHGICGGQTTLPGFNNVSGQVSVTQTGFALNRATGLWSATMTVKNTGTTPIGGPIRVVLINLSSNATMTNYAGFFSGRPFITVSTGTLAVGASVSVTIQFRNPSNLPITYTPVTGSFPG
jgi:hypothetical protein